MKQTTLQPLQSESQKGADEPIIGIICPSDFTKKERSGGASGFLASIFSEIDSPAVIFGIGRNDTSPWQKVALQSNIIFTAIATVKVPSAIPLRIKTLFWYIWYRNHILQAGANVLYIHSPECVLPFIFLNKRIPVIYHQHGSGNPVQTATYQWGRGKLFKQLFDLVSRIIYKRADWIIAIDRFCLEQSVQGGAGKKVSLLMNAIDTQTFKPDDSLRHLMRQRLNLNDSAVAIIFVGRLEEVKRIDRAIEALTYLRQDETQYHLYISGEGGMKKHLESLVIEKQLTSFVTFLGHVSHAELPAYYNMADILVLPSEMEGVPMVILESLATGLPVVASRVGGIPDLIIEGVNGFTISDPSPSNLAVSLRRVSSANLNRSAIAKSAERYSSRQFVLEFQRIVEVVRHSRVRDQKCH